jgi:hypothetical protein
MCTCVHMYCIGRRAVGSEIMIVHRTSQALSVTRFHASYTQVSDTSRNQKQWTDWHRLPMMSNTWLTLGTLPFFSYLARFSAYPVRQRQPALVCVCLVRSAWHRRRPTAPLFAPAIHPCYTRGAEQLPEGKSMRFVYRGEQMSHHLNHSF